MCSAVAPTADGPRLRVVRDPKPVAGSEIRGSGDGGGYRCSIRQDWRPCCPCPPMPSRWQSCVLARCPTFPIGPHWNWTAGRSGGPSPNSSRRTAGQKRLNAQHEPQLIASCAISVSIAAAASGGTGPLGLRGLQERGRDAGSVGSLSGGPWRLRCRCANSSARLPPAMGQFATRSVGARRAWLRWPAGPRELRPARPRRLRPANRFQSRPATASSRLRATASARTWLSAGLLAAARFTAHRRGVATVRPLPVRPRSRPSAGSPLPSSGCSAYSAPSSR